MRQAIRRALKGTTAGYDFKYRVRRLDAQWLWVRAVGHLADRRPDGRALRVSGTDEDVSAAKAAEQALIESQRRRRMVTDNLPALIAYIDCEQRYLFLNACIRRVRGTDVETSIGRTMREVRGNATYAVLAPHVEAALRGEKASFTYTEQIDCCDVHYRANYIPDIDAAGQVEGLYALTFDITEQHEAPRQVVACMRAPFECDGVRVDVTTSVGVANCRNAGATAAELIARADAALYQAKSQGRDRYAIA